jgi:thiol:disulfide interchange protein DsbC
VLDELPLQEKRGERAVAAAAFVELAETQALWCDPRLLRELNFSDRLPESGCNAILAHHIGLSQWLGIKASPSWVLPNGDLVRGYQSPEQLLKILDHIMPCKSVVVRELMIPICPPPCTRYFARSSPAAG